MVQKGLYMFCKQQKEFIRKRIVDSLSSGAVENNI